MGHTGHVYRVKANSQEQAIKRVDTYLNAFNDTNIWHYIISVFDSKGKYTKIYEDVVANFPETSEELDKFLIGSLKPEAYSEEAFNKVKVDSNNCNMSELSFAKDWIEYLIKMKHIQKYGFDRETYPEINSGCIEEQGLTDLTTRCKTKSKQFFVVAYIHA